MRLSLSVADRRVLQLSAGTKPQSKLIKNLLMWNKSKSYDDTLEMEKESRKMGKNQCRKVQFSLVGQIIDLLIYTYFPWRAKVSYALVVENSFITFSEIELEYFHN